MGDDTPAKRRRTSLVTFASFGNRSYGDAHVSPTPKRASSHFAAGRPDLPQTPKRASTHDGIRSPTRASFMSPTTASLARFHPHLLPPSTSSDSKLPFPAGSRTQSNWNDSRLELSGEKILVNRSVKPAIPEKGPGTDGGNSTAGADRTAPEPKGLFNTPPFKAPGTAQLQVSPASGVRASLPKVPEDNQEVSPAALRVQLDPEPQNSTSVDQISNEDLIDTDDAYEHESEVLQAYPKCLLDGFSEIAKPRLSSISNELGHEPAPAPSDALLFSSPSIRPWGKEQLDVNSSPPAPLPSSSLVSGAPSLKPRTGLGPRKLITKTWQSEPIQLGSSATSSSGTGFSRHASSLAQRLALFLPFSKPTKKPGTADSRREASTDHRQIPHLVKVSVTEGTSPPANSKDSISGEQHSSLQCPHEGVPLTVKFHLSIDRKTQKYTKLEISSISPWATVELGRWLRTEAVDLDRPTIEKTISRYWELSRIRATCWHRCEHDLKHNLAESHDENPSPPGNGPPNSPQFSLSSFQPYLGQQSLCLTQFPGIVLLINWRVAISPDGFVQSILSGHASFPDSWTEKTSDAAALGKIGEVFDLLVQEFGVFEAVRTLGGVIFRK